MLDLDGLVRSVERQLQHEVELAGCMDKGEGCSDFVADCVSNAHTFSACFEPLVVCGFTDPMCLSVYDECLGTGG